MKIHTRYIDGDFKPRWLEYSNKNIALTLESCTDGIIKASTNPDILLPPGTVAIKNYSENEGLYRELMACFLIRGNIMRIDQGFVKTPVCQPFIEDPDNHEWVQKAIDEGDDVKNWRHMILKRMQETCDHPDNVVSIAGDIDTVFDSGYGTSNGPRFFVWTKDNVYGPAEYDGSDYVFVLPRNPA